jgi:hypothetical protein
VRQDVMRNLRLRVRELAAEGLTIGEIGDRLDRGLSETEREIVWQLARQEVQAAQEGGAERPARGPGNRA